jgi:hypothetical protein
MKQFIIKILNYSIAIILIQCILIAGYFYLDFSKPIIVNKNKLVSRNQILILGNSHSECAINDGLLPSKYINISNSSEPLFYSSSKARYLLNKFQNDTIVIEFTNISPLTTEWVLGDAHLIRNLHKNLSFIDQHCFDALFKANPSKCIKAILSISPNNIFQKGKIFGSYLSLEREEITAKVVNFKNRWMPNSFNSKIKNQNINFNELIRLITDFPRTKFIIIRSPMHKSFEYFDEIGFKQKVNQITNFPNAKFYDFAHVINNDSFFGDVEHLNDKGANFFTPIFLNTIRVNSSKSNSYKMTKILTPLLKSLNRK